jgi:hypothetical protein
MSRRSPFDRACDAAASRSRRLREPVHVVLESADAFGPSYETATDHEIETHHLGSRALASFADYDDDEDDDEDDPDYPNETGEP